MSVLSWYMQEVRKNARETNRFYKSILEGLEKVPISSVLGGAALGSYLDRRTRHND